MKKVRNLCEWYFSMILEFSVGGHYLDWNAVTCGISSVKVIQILGNG